MKFSASIFFVLSVAANAAGTNNLPALSPAYPEMPPPFWQRHIVVILVGCLVFVALAAAALRAVFKSKPPVILPPEKIARDALMPLQSQPEDGKLLSQVSQILRRYVGAVFGFPPGEMTTAEFCAVMAAQTKISPQLAETLSTFLHACDRDKFVAQKKAPPLNAAARALQLVDQMEKCRAELSAQISASK